MLYRANTADLQIRSDGRTVVGIAVPFDAPTQIREATGSFVETFRRGAFARTIRERLTSIKFLAQHDRRALPLGRLTAAREDHAGLWIEARVSKTAAGDEALELINDGALDGLSVGFEPVRDNWSPKKDRVERLEVKLREVSAVSFPAYTEALIAGVRSQTPLIPADVARRRLILLELPK
jgi:HK97 family phage prohead protease